jgi:glucose-6-phosphate 1-dehydrogenase
MIGAVKSGWNLEDLRARAKDSIEKRGGVDPRAFDRLNSPSRHLDGDYQDPARF